jgi:hypothetical protein
MEYILIDKRMRNIEKNTLKYLGYRLVNIEESNNVYAEISSHVDIFTTKIGDTLVVEKSKYEDLLFMLKDSEYNIICGKDEVGINYPDDIKYNVCIVGNYAIHNFKYTDKTVLKMLKENGYELIDVEQGYTNCSIAVIDDSSVITTDKKIAEKLIANNISVLFLDYTPDIKLKDEYGNYSSMNGFIGGAIGKVDNNIIIFGDLEKIDKDNKIRDYIKVRNLNIIDFKGLDVIDYGGLVEV